MHQSVLYQEALTGLRIKPDGIYVDCTFGRGGHSAGVLQQLGVSGRLLAIDRDPEAIRSAEACRLQSDPRFSLYHASFAELKAIAESLNLSGRVDGLLLDLGVSSPQLDTAERGFSFLREGPLDMRMDSSQGMTAADYLAQVEEQELVRVLFEYGEERFARRIAAAVVKERKHKPIRTTAELVALIEACVPFKEKHKHPATRSFQAIRIEINQELQQVQQILAQSAALLAHGGRLVVIAFHSLEDRIVKRFIKNESGNKTDPGRLPVKEQDIVKGQFKKIGAPIRAGSEELKTNPRARSAVMRVAEKL
ncbi:16S rRNA (cytosine(1402)-N(4))-methyltransferase RsmH [Methylomonas sp. HYX-M1]|uniref:16S rRNA (cytosine(1402)-N(4))-methyltransferase RsmH n=1 Tax=Methylomonas sp. HYX-M1 TaxID=3139307 RepID=UPI00345BB470